ncbi:dihydroorotate dehydrogenase Ura3 [Schizosaccharomyces cryophilus OY26]|uniref:Dihydroorotate dehydrogenase (quinone), mitochondrial n=1 Tax=Schizosaccharomyces cryophilus (strain OY26 / ATCC MYA-4695 / CBS 11777 / NBRC 106824 / NRRL Y48691) TaxID=653667 RepID=S9XB12_SCHCR|nr:dihydroorotate dehydrogenase Ura3 [Schizosaccharomyces cryophilus OY26]EPY50936.1 dihydroorotate dehydrogenase Ura3 [Schizosaccharomyces cryophilus OY26]
MLSRNAYRLLSRNVFKHGGKSFQSNLHSASSKPNSFFRGNWKLWSLLGSFSAGWMIYDMSDVRSFIHGRIEMPLFHAFTTPEFSHSVAVLAASWGITPRDFTLDDQALAVEVWGKKFSNPVGLAAGFDKQADAISGLLNFGFSYLEVGSVTPLPQPGNPKPRYFRLDPDLAVVNRYGFNSQGHEAILEKVQKRIRKYIAKNKPGLLKDFDANPAAYTDPSVLGVPRSLLPNKYLGINLGKNKNGNEIEDYVTGVRNFGNYADVLVINVSSPNTPGLRSLQRKSALTELLSATIAERNKLNAPNPPLVVKIAPDLSETELADIAAVLKKCKVDGVIVGNTTIQRPDTLKSTKHVQETGGLSGPPLKPITLNTLRTLRKHLSSDIPIIGCGGISNGKDAIEYARAGASMVQVYTALGYDGPVVAHKIKQEILAELNGKRWVDIVGKEN